MGGSRSAARITFLIALFMGALGLVLKWTTASKVLLAGSATAMVLSFVMLFASMYVYVVDNGIPVEKKWSKSLYSVGLMACYIGLYLDNPPSWLPEAAVGIFSIGFIFDLAGIRGNGSGT